LENPMKLTIQSIRKAAAITFVLALPAFAVRLHGQVLRGYATDMGTANEAGNLIPVWMVTSVTQLDARRDDVKITHCTTGNAPTGYTHSLTAGHGVYHVGELVGENNQPLLQAGASQDVNPNGTDNSTGTPNPPQNGNADNSSTGNPDPGSEGDDGGNNSPAPSFTIATGFFADPTGSDLGTLIAQAPADGMPAGTGVPSNGSSGKPLTGGVAEIAPRDPGADSNTGAPPIVHTDRPPVAQPTPAEGPGPPMQIAVPAPQPTKATTPAPSGAPLAVSPSVPRSSPPATAPAANIPPLKSETPEPDTRGEPKPDQPLQGTGETQRWHPFNVELRIVLGPAETQAWENYLLAHPNTVRREVMFAYTLSKTLKFSNVDAYFSDGSAVPTGLRNAIATAAQNAVQGDSSFLKFPDATRASITRTDTIGASKDSTYGDD
jgi:hypothetical protein